MLGIEDAPEAPTREELDGARLALDVAERATRSAWERIEAAAPDEAANYAAASQALRAADRLLALLEEAPPPQ